MTKKSQKKKTLLLLDGNAIIHRAFHALPPLTSADGTQTNAVYGFTSTLLNVLEKFQPDYIIASFDVPGKNFRHEMYPEYKGTRKETPEDLVPQFALTREVVKACNITIVEKSGVEADDVIGTLAVQATAEGIETVIVTGDKDTLQLVDDHVSVFTMSRGIQDMLLYDTALVIEKMGITPEQVIEYKGLRGDTSDNIPGVRGIGDKGATDLLTRFGTLDGIYDHIDDEHIKEGVRKKLVEQKELAYLSRELGIIKTDVDVTLDVKNAQSADLSLEGARTVFAKLGFKSLVKRLPNGIHETPAPTAQEMEDVVVIEENIDTLREIYTGQEVSLILDVEHGVLHGIALATAQHAHYVPYKDTTREALQSFLIDSTLHFVTFDAKALLHLCDSVQLPQPFIKTDVLLQAYVLHTGKKLEFEQLVFDVSGEHHTYQQEGAQLTLDLRDDVHAQHSSLQRARDTHMLFQQFKKDIAEVVKTQPAEANLTTLLEHIEMPTLYALYAMEKAGIAFDTEIFSRIAHQTNAAIAKLVEDIHSVAGSEFNINSTQQLRVVLFETLGLPTDVVKKTKTGYSTAASELEKLRDVHPIIAKIETYRELFKLKTTYIDALPKLVDVDGRIHSTFNQAVTATGRLSSSDPNLQNIPTRTETGRALREGFVAAKGNVLISADYSQIDLRCVAHVAGDKQMIKAFNDHADIHTFTAASVLGKELHDVTKVERSSAKELNFGLIYGMGVRSFAKSAGITTTAAQDFVDAYFKKFSGVKKYMDVTKKEAKEKGYVETLLGRRKYTPELQSANAMLRAAGERAAINMPIQGLTADIMKLAMIAVHEYLKHKYTDGSVNIVLQIHDEIILEAPRDDARVIATDIKKIMEGVYKLDVPLTVDTEIGTHWGEL